MGLFFKKNKLEDIENAILAMDNGLLEWDDLSEILHSRGIDEERYRQIRLEAHKKRAQMGDVNSQYWCGLLMQEKEKKESLRYYTMAAEQGHIGAMSSLANAYSEYTNSVDGIDLGFGENPQKELYWTRRGAEAGDVNAMIKLARDYSLGEIIEENTGEQEKWLWTAANSGSAEAYVELGGLPKYYEDIPQRVELYRKGLSLCHDRDTFERLAWGLGECYFPYENNSYADPRKSAYGYSLAYILGNEYGAEWVKKTGYQATEVEWNEWVNDARNQKFRM